VYDSLFNSVKTVATDINDDFTTLSKEDFITKYYHLRPGTYDITSLRYEQNPGLLQRNMKSDVAKEESLVLDEMTLARISTTLQEHDITGNASTFITFFRKATEARELSKFEFTKNLSDALEEIANAGEMMGFTRKEIAMLDVQDILTANGDVQQITQQWKELIQAREHKREIDDQLVLNSVIVTEDDFDVIEHYKAKPNFITQKMIDSTIVHIEDVGEDTPDIEGSVVLIENGDPGYDWIFTRKIAGLITKYGGVASHMSIRCAEFGIPAAIGCGDLIFNTVKNGSHVTLDCKQQKIISRDEK
jgi:phosphohistidine swiveling domain-containing protein